MNPEITAALTNNAPDILDLLIKLVLLALSSLLAFASSRLPAKWRKEAENAALAAEQKLRESLHSAAKSGAEAGLKQGLVGSELIRFGLRHILKSVPDAVVGLTPTTKDLLASGPVDEVLDRLNPRVREAFENIVASKIDLNKVDQILSQRNRPMPKPPQDQGWQAPHVPIGPHR